MTAVTKYQNGQSVIVANFGVFGAGTRNVVEAKIVCAVGEQYKVRIGSHGKSDVTQYLTEIYVDASRIYPLTIEEVQELILISEELIKTYQLQDLAHLYKRYPFIISEKRMKKLIKKFNKDWQDLSHMEPNRLWNAFQAQVKCNLFGSKVNKWNLVRALILPPREENVANEMRSRFERSIKAGEYSKAVTKDLKFLLS
eukprot:gene15131-16886_t